MRYQTQILSLDDSNAKTVFITFNSVNNWQNGQFLAFWSKAIRLTGISLTQGLTSFSRQLTGVNQMSVGLVVFDKKA
jgi:hypothetical protein